MAALHLLLPAATQEPKGNKLRDRPFNNKQNVPRLTSPGNIISPAGLPSYFYLVFFYKIHSPFSGLGTDTG